MIGIESPNAIMKHGEKELTIIAHTLCNEDCHYCIHKDSELGFRHQYFKPGKLSLLKNVDFSQYKFVTIEGGELGLLSEMELKSIVCSVLMSGFPIQNIVFSTNGLMLEKYGDLFPGSTYVRQIVRGFVDYPEIPNIRNVIVLTQDRFSFADFVLSQNPDHAFYIALDLTRAYFNQEYYDNCVAMFGKHKNAFYDLEMPIDSSIAFQSLKHFNMLHNLHRRYHEEMIYVDVINLS